MSRALGCAVLLLLGATAGGIARAQESAQAVRKVVIAPFSGKAGQDARAAVLQQIAGRTDRTDFTVIGHDDVEIVAKRLGVAPDSEQGRKVIGAELGIDLWIDGELDTGGEGALRLSTSDGARITKLSVAGRDSTDAGAELREKLWPWLGSYLSEQERIVRKIDNERTRALEKLAAREDELARQKQIVLENEQRRMKRLEAARTLARSKATARDQELAHQVQIVRERELAVARAEQERQEELQRQQAEQQRLAALEQQRQQAEQQRLAALEQQRQQAEQAALQQQQQQQAAASQPAGGGGAGPPPAQWQQPQAQPTANVWQPPPTQWRQPQAAQPRPGTSQQPQPAAPASSWQPPPTAQGPQRPQPAGAAAQPPPPAETPVQGPAQIDGISPETREWLQRKQRERAAGGVN